VQFWSWKGKGKEMFREVHPSLFNIAVECDISKKVGEEVIKSTRDGREDVGDALLVSATFTYN
jgi:hypothetical protein